MKLNPFVLFIGSLMFLVAGFTKPDQIQSQDVLRLVQIIMAAFSFAFLTLGCASFFSTKE